MDSNQPPKQKVVYFGTSDKFLEDQHGGFMVEADIGDELTVMQAVAETLKCTITDVILYRIDAKIRLKPTVLAC